MLREAFAPMLLTLTRFLAALPVLASLAALPAWSASDLQTKAEAAFGHAVGGAVVMRAADGKVLAVVDPDLACAQTHPPGSIFKLVTAFAALEEHLVTPNDHFTCNGWRKLGGMKLNCAIPNGHGRLNLSDAIARSCNVTFYGLGVRLGPERIIQYADLLGLGNGCPGYSGQQVRGALPKPPVHPVDIARLAIGQCKGLSITVLEAAEMTRRIAIGSVPARSKSSLAVVREGMRHAVTSGTCRAAAVKGIAVAGKTGSTEAPGNEDERDAWFVGFAPYDKPEVIVVVYARRGHGYDKAAPIAGRILAAYFARGAR